jgi:hypothetical protein
MKTKANHPHTPRERPEKGEIDPESRNVNQLKGESRSTNSGINQIANSCVELRFASFDCDERLEAIADCLVNKRDTKAEQTLRFWLTISAN